MTDQLANPNTALVAVYKTHTGAEAAIRTLADAKIPMSKLSIIGRGYHSEEQVVGFYNAGDRIKIWGKFGAFWGGLWGLMTGGMYLTLPVIGSVIVLGPLGAVIMGGIEGAVLTGGLSALGAALFSIGIPQNTVIDYEEEIKADGFIMLMEGTPQEIEQARALLGQSQAKQIDTHSCSGKSVDSCDTLPMKAATSVA